MKHNFNDYREIDPVAADYICTVSGAADIKNLSLPDINGFFNGLVEYHRLETQENIEIENLEISNYQLQENHRA